MDLFSAFNGDGVNYFDSDGRLGKGTYNSVGSWAQGINNLARDAYFSISYALSSVVYGSDAANRWYGQNWQGLKQAVGGTAQTVYDTSATATYAVGSLIDNDSAYKYYGGSVQRFGNAFNALRGGEGNSAAYQIGYGGFNAATMLLPLRWGNAGRAGTAEISTITSLEMPSLRGGLQIRLNPQTGTIGGGEISRLNPPLNTSKLKNGGLAGETHPVTGVPFDKQGFPVFDSFHDVQLPSNLASPAVADATQFRYATANLRETLQANPNLKANFTTEQLAAIEQGAPRIPGYTWHHNQDGVTLQLVDENLHSGTGHSGGRQTTGGRP